MSQPSKLQKKHIHTFALLGVALLAIIAIALSIFALLNPGSNETTTTTSTSSVIITEHGISPPTVTVNRGDGVTWINQDAAAHRLVITSPNPPAALQGFATDSPLSQGESYSFVFEASGTFTYDDPQNPEHIQGTVIVK